MRDEFWDARAATIRECAESGMSPAETANKLTLTTATVRKYATIYAIEFAGKPVDDIEKTLRELAETGQSQKEAAEILGKWPTWVSVNARKFGIKFRHGREGFGVDQHRADQMAALYKGGYTLEQIGAQFSITRERVRQVIKKQRGLSAVDGGQSVTAAARRQRREERQDARYMQRYGCLFSEWQELVEIGKRMMAEGAKRARTPTGAFSSQRRNAAKRGIGWELSLWQWWSIWQQSGHWSERGRGQGYVMCRHGDDGPYAVGNVFIATARENCSDKKCKKSGLPIGVKKVQKGNYLRFIAHRSINGEKKRLGVFKTPELAHAAYLMAGAA